MWTATINRAGSPNRRLIFSPIFCSLLILPFADLFLH